MQQVAAERLLAQALKVKHLALGWRRWSVGEERQSVHDGDER